MIKKDFFLVLLVAVVLSLFLYALHRVAFPYQDQELLNNLHYDGKSYILKK